MGCENQNADNPLQDPRSPIKQKFSKNAASVTLTILNICIIPLLYILAALMDVAIIQQEAASFIYELYFLLVVASTFAYLFLYASSCFEYAFVLPIVFYYLFFISVSLYPRLITGIFL